MSTSSARPVDSRRFRAAAIRRQADFQRIYQHGRRYRGKFLTAVVLSCDEVPGCRAAYVVSRKVAKHAVRRNLIRRRLREALRRLGQECGVRGGLDLVLIATARAPQATYWDLRGELHELLRRAGVWVGPAVIETETGRC